MFLGSRAAAAPYVLASKLFTALYFAYFLVVLPTLALIGEFSAKNMGKVTTTQRSYTKDKRVLSSRFGFTRFFSTKSKRTEDLLEVLRG